MHIIILGAGRISQFVAQSLSLDGHSIVLVDISREKLEEMSQKMDIAIRRGVGTDWKLLNELMEENPELLLALTDDDEINLVACTIVKSLGNVRTIARIKDSNYLRHAGFDVARLFHIDHIVVPELLVANQISKILLNQGLYSESFFYGGVLLRTVIVPKDWKNAGKTLTELRTSERRLIVALIRRKNPKNMNDEIIFPHGQDALYPGDEVTLIGDNRLPKEIESFFGIPPEVPESAFIVGGTLVGVELARELTTTEMSVRLVESDATKSYHLAEELPKVSVLCYPNINWEHLKIERVDQTDVFVAATASEEKNMQIALFAKELGCKKVISVFSDFETTKLAEKLGISHTVSPRIATTDRILALVRAGKVSSVVSLYDQRAEIMEVKVSATSPLVGIPLSVLGPHLPPELLIAVIYNRGRILIASGSHILSPQDEVLIVCHPKYRTYLEQIF